MRKLILKPAVQFTTLTIEAYLILRYDQTFLTSYFYLKKGYMRITLFGAGYVGLVTATCLAEYGNHVLCIDIDQTRVSQLKAGICPIHEPELPTLLQKNLASGRLDFSSDLSTGIQHGFYQFITVDTPQSEYGSADLCKVFAVANNIGNCLVEPRLIITKSTVPVGTAEKVRSIIDQLLERRGVNVGFAIASNPEFLRQGTAVSDFMYSDRIIMGTDTLEAENHLRALYKPFNPDQDRLIL